MAVVASLLVLAGCGVEAGNRAATGSRGDNVDIVGSDVAETTTTSQTTTTIAPPADLEIVGAADTETNAVAANAVADLEDWWTRAYPEAYDTPYEPLAGGLYAIDSSTNPVGIPCSLADVDQMLDNAFYCPTDDAVVWDQERFLPELADRYGPFTVAIVIAHEWGHAIQERSRFQSASVIYELQADCFAGAWAAHVAHDDDARFSVTTDELDQALAGVLSLRDAPGGTADDPYAHGSGFDRVGAFQDGFEEGVTRCAAFNNSDPAPYQWPFTDPVEFENQGDLPLSGPEVDDDIVDLTFPALDAYWTDTYPTLGDGDSWDPLTDPVAFTADDPPTCGGETVEDFLLFVCIPDRYVGYDAESTIPAAYDQNGDFAVATLFSTQYGLDVVEQLGSADSEVQATLQADCLTGAWAAAILPSDEPSTYDLVLSPGDLDEAVAVLLSFRSDADRQRQGPGFDRVRAFRRGVLKGPASCTEITGG